MAADGFKPPQSDGARMSVVLAGVVSQQPQCPTLQESPAQSGIADPSAQLVSPGEASVPRRDLAERFLTGLDEGADAFLFAAFDDNKERSPALKAKILYGSLDEHFPLLTGLNAKGYGIFVTINVTAGDRRRAEDVTRVRAVFRDWDKPGEFRPPLPLTPSIVVCTSPGKFHDYLLVDDLPLDQFQPVQRRLVDRYGSDPSVTDLPRVMRLPGFINRKLGANGHLVTIIEGNPEIRYAATQILAAFPPDEAGLSNPTRADDAVSPADWTRVEDAIAKIPPDCVYQEWLQTGQALHSTGDGRAFDLWDGWSSGGGAKYPGREELTQRWASFAADGGLTIGTLFHIAKAHGWRNTEFVGAGEGGGTNSDLSQDALAQQFAREHPTLRWVEQMSYWVCWDGSRWRKDSVLSVFDLVRRFLRVNATRLADDQKHARQLKSAAGVAAVEVLSRSDPRFAATVEQWDLDPLLFNTPDGIVFLRTGTLEPSDPERYQTKMAGAAPAGQCEQWLAFLDEVMGGDQELVDYLQRVVGYCLTGSTKEHALFFCYGTGSNGKSVFLSTLSGVLGDYAAVAPMTAFTETRAEQHPTDLAGLRGARLVTANETEEGKRWNESRIKQLTGGDAISARLMRQDFFTFVPTFKLMIAGNHRPRLRTVGEAMKRRIHMIPFMVTIPPERRDLELTEKLKAEWPGILAWAIAGCLKWQAGGLRPPAGVLEATAAYLDGQNVHSAWLEECCETGPEKWCSPKGLYDAWKHYADERGEHPGRQVEFSARMEAAGFHQKKHNERGRYWAGIGIKPGPAGAPKESPF